MGNPSAKVAAVRKSLISGMGHLCFRPMQNSQAEAGSQYQHGSGSQLGSPQLEICQNILFL
jgi:hypothetical protein